MAHRSQLGVDFLGDFLHAGLDVLARRAFAQDAFLVHHGDRRLLRQHGRGEAGEDDREDEKCLEKFHNFRTLFSY